MKNLAVAFALLLPTAGLAQIPPDAGFTFYTIPGIVNASGLNNTRFVSDVAVTNSGTKDAFLAVTFVPAGSLAPQVLALPAGATTVWRNVLQRLWSFSGAGALSIASASPTAVSIAPAEGIAGPDEYGTPMRILPDGLAFSRPALLVRSYGSDDLLGVALEGLSLAVSDGSAWYALTGGSIQGAHLPGLSRRPRHGTMASHAEWVSSASRHHGSDADPGCDLHSGLLRQDRPCLVSVLSEVSRRRARRRKMKTSSRTARRRRAARE